MIRYYSVPKETFVTNGTIVEPLNVTENGTYAPPAGTAYSPVVVNVEGGGGSSDFSTAEVTLVITGDGDVEIPVVEGAPMNCINVRYPADEGTYTCPLYKGALNVKTYPIDEEATYSISVTGNAEVFDAEIYITGNCTITIS